ncbi:MAG: integrase core domain-containing protein [Nannocystaceae bacterium]|nr:integrase core domain-containing protein [Nannocystaceae bacterium]
MLAKLQQLGVMPSCSRPHATTNAFADSVAYGEVYPPYPDGPFADLDAARASVTAFLAWYNDQHLHSAVGFVTRRSATTGTTSWSSSIARPPN